MGLRGITPERLKRNRGWRLGPLGHLFIFLWTLAMVLLIPMPKLVYSSALSLIVAALLYPSSFHHVLRLRSLFMLALLVLPPLFFIEENGTQVALQIGLRFVVVITAVNGFTQAVDISQIAGMLERFGLRGLGFSLGIALNLLPSLQQSSIHAWQSLRMRGGLRQKKWRGLRLLIVTIITNALRRADEIALAAESRAFSPDHSRPMPLPVSLFDGLLLPIGVLSILVILQLP